MSRSPIRLQYFPASQPQLGAQIDNPLFELLGALHDHGSIRAAAEAMAQSYRHVWGTVKLWEGVIGEPLVLWQRGKPAVLTPFAVRLLWAERRARVRMMPHIEALRLGLEQVMHEAGDPRWQSVEVHASHDLALPHLQALAHERQLHVDQRFFGSLQALRDLAEGRCTVAGFHVPRTMAASPRFAQALEPWLQPGKHKLIACHRRQQGLMVNRAWASRVIGIHDLRREGLRFVNRATGCGTRLLMDTLIDDAGIDRTAINGWEERTEETHVAVAAAIASGAGDVGPGLAAAAHSFGLGFVPLVEENYYLVCLKDVLDSPAVLRLREMLASPEWRSVIEGLPGYAAVADAGEVLSLSKTLPWWSFKQPRARARRKAVQTSSPRTKAAA